MIPIFIGWYSSDTSRYEVDLNLGVMLDLGYILHGGTINISLCKQGLVGPSLIQGAPVGSLRLSRTVGA
jgi:hypothetical protein